VYRRARDAQGELFFFRPPSAGKEKSRSPAQPARRGRPKKTPITTHKKNIPITTGMFKINIK